MVNRKKMWGLFLMLSTLAVLVHGQTGFISIDCGIPENSSYRHPVTDILYSSDTQFIETGVNKNVSAADISEDIQLFQSLRYFPEGDRNCYNLQPVEVGSKYLIRVYFLYGDYDGLNTPPNFDLYIGVDYWATIDSLAINETIIMATKEYIPICLVNTGQGTPFISAIELRKLSQKLYPSVNESFSLVLYKREDMGATKVSRYRYPDDEYDRVWTARNLSAHLDTTNTINVDDSYYRPPSKVMQSASVAPVGESRIVFPWLGVNPESDVAIFLHFSEIEKLKSNETREFNCTLNDGPYSFNFFKPPYLIADIIYIDLINLGDNYTVSLVKTENSTHPPLINAAEFYIVRRASGLATADQDVDAIIKIKIHYGMKKNWVGDPCLPKNYSWRGLSCSFDYGRIPRISSLNLSSSGLTGEIPFPLADLTSIQLIDLSNNTLSGPIPEFLAKLPELKTLVLTGNELSGSIPPALLSLVKTRPLKLSADGNPNLCLAEPCNKIEKQKQKSKTGVIIVAVVVSSFAIITVISLIIWIFKRQTGEGDANALIYKDDVLREENKRFTFADIVSITNNFEKEIGSGGFGTVYMGEMTDGSEVAVKVLSKPSAQQQNQFHTEAHLLTRVHHRKIVSLIGYCDEDKCVALIYEYMANGDLAKHLYDNDAKATLTWERRIQILLDAAQGLEYLHSGCRPSIIHRDIKATNILLNERFEAKISDFGLSKIKANEEATAIMTVVKGTLGYLDPEYYTTNQLNDKSDVYSFGVLLLEVVTGQPPISKGSRRSNIVEWVKSTISTGNINDIIDPRLRVYNSQSASKIVEIAMACTLPTSNQRPTMNRVVSELQQCISLDLSLKKREGRESNDFCSQDELVSFAPSAR